MIGTLMLVLLAMPLALSMLNYQTTNLEDFSARPIKDFGLSADPVNNIADCVITNMDDTDNLYGGAYRAYIMTLNVSDAEGSGTVANVTATFGSVASFLWKNTTTYHATTGCITQPLGSTLLTLVSSTNTTTGAGLTLNITITFEVEWAMTDADGVDLVVLTYDDLAASDTDTKSAYVDFDTDLTLASDVFFTYTEEQQGDIMTLNTLTYSYENSGGDNYPLAAETDFWVSRAARAGWAIEYYEAASYAEATGIASWTPMRATDNEHTDTFTLYAVNQAGGSADTSLMEAAHTDTIDIVEGNPVQTPRPTGVVPDDIFATPEGAMAVGVIVVVIVGGGYFYSTRSGGAKTTRRKKPTKRRKTKKAVKRKRR